GEIEASLVPKDRPTDAGRAIVAQTRTRRSDRAYRRRTALTRVLVWADQTEGGSIHAILTSDYARIDGKTVTLKEAAEAVESLHHDGLVKGNVQAAWGGDVVRASATITPLGRRVLDEHNGDVGAWRTTLDRATPAVSIGYNSGAIAIGGDNST